MKKIFHIASVNDWEKGQKVGEYTVDSLIKQGFIHCSKLEQVIEVANFLFKGRDDLVLLSIDPLKVKSEIKFEIPEGENKSYPHIYGPLNVNSVMQVYPFKPNTDGTFNLPIIEQ